MIKDLVKQTIQRYPAISNPIWKAIYPRSKRNLYDEFPPSDSRAAAFREIYLANRWHSEESRSGWGSTMSATGPLRRALPKLLRKLDVSTMLDAPCGDFHWMRHVDLGGVSYVGADIVPDIIADLNTHYAAPNRRFQILDIVTGPLPAADLWLCRDVLFHLPNKEITQVLENFIESDVGHILTSSFPLSTKNPDVHPGGFRTINLRLAPFNLPKPMLEIDDFVVAATPRILGLWSREQITSWRARSGSRAPEPN